MRGKFHKGLVILSIAIFIGVFFQFSIDKRPIGEQEFIFKPSPPPFMTDSSSWADSIYKELDLTRRIGQLIMVAAYPGKGKTDVRRVSRLIQKHHVGGVIFFKGTAEDVSRLTNYYQSISQVPLLFAIDGEWGPSMRLKNTIKYPRQMMLGAIDNNDLIYDMGRDVGKQLRMLGIHINFAPVIDVNNNPDNPVIGSRSFGESRENVARKGIMYMRGMQDERIIAVAKHFPGHGDTDHDSHHELPLIPHNADRLDSIELFPFKALIEGGIGGIMTAHLNIPALDSTKDLPSTLSYLIIDSLLKQEMKFRGLVFTDAMNMKGVASGFEAEDANLRALYAGNDILLMPEDIKSSIDKITKSARDSIEFLKQIDIRCRKILEAKAWAVQPFLFKEKLPEEVLLDSLNSPYFELARRKLIEGSLTVVSNSNDILPIKNLESWKIASVSIGADAANEFHNNLSLYSDPDHYSIDDETDSASLVLLFENLQNYNLVFLSLHSDDFRAYRQFGISNHLIKITDRLLVNYPCVLTAFTSPYLLSKLNNLHNNKALIVAYENDPVTLNLAAQLIFGAISADAHLPVSINKEYPAGRGISIKSINRLKYTLPLEAGFNEINFKKIDSIVFDGISKKAMPGCQVLIARKGKVVFNKSYGYHTYYRKRKVLNTDLYDLASLTKIIATVPAIMQLEDENKIDIRQSLSNYLPELDTTNKSRIKIDDILLHQAGLKSWIPFYQAYLTPIYPKHSFAKSRYSKQYPIRIGKHFYVNKHLKYTPGSFSRTADSIYTRKIADGFYMNPALAGSIYLKIYASEVKKKGNYLYSDLGYYLFLRMIEQITETSFDLYLQQNFYESLGATTLGFKPLERFNADQIAPTENDLIFRRQVVHAYVHDPGAAMLGGVAGHAGLFSNSNDLAKFSQMLLNKGVYGDKRYLNKKLVEKYTDCPDCKKGNRRGLGFDKPEPDTTKHSPAFKGIPLESFGHSGFTGTMVWMDPSTDILYIFLSNRVYPEAASNKLAEMDIRTNIQKVIYESVIE